MHVNRWVGEGRGEWAGELDKGDKGHTNVQTQFPSSFPNRAADCNMHFSFPSNLFQFSCAAGVYLQRPKQWALVNFCLPQIVLLPGLVFVGLFFLSEYIFQIKILYIQDNFYFPCSYTGYISPIILLFVGILTYCI